MNSRASDLLTEKRIKREGSRRRGQRLKKPTVAKKTAVTGNTKTKKKRKKNKKQKIIRKHRGKGIHSERK